MKLVTVRLNTVQDVKNFVKITSLCPYDVDLLAERYIINAKSIMGIFSLDLHKPVRMQLHSDDSDDVLAKLEPFLIEDEG